MKMKWMVTDFAAGIGFQAAADEKKAVTGIMAAAGKVAAAAVATGVIFAATAAFAVPAMASETGSPYFYELSESLDQLLAEENESGSFGNTALEASPTYVRSAGTEPTADQFLADLKNSYEARLSVLNRYADFETMKENTYNTYRFLCAEAERPFYDAYSGVTFANKNYQFLCDAYLGGLSTQYEAEMMWKEEGAPEEIETFFLEGFDRRAEVLKEVSAYYLTTLVLEDFNSTVNITKIVEDAVAKNKEADKQLVVQVQTRLNELGYDCGTADGQAGQKTVLAICHFQMASGAATPDGLADQELLDQMNQ